MPTLYIKPGCPFCYRVLNAARELNVVLDLKDISDQAVSEELIEKGGKRQVPYLVDEQKGEAMYESDNIIKYLTEKYNNGNSVGDIPTGGVCPVK